MVDASLYSELESGLGRDDRQGNAKLGPNERQSLLDRWMSTSSDAEKDRMERAERMVRQAIDSHAAFDGYRNDIKVYAKGSYANHTNIRLDSDVDIVVENHDLFYYDFLPESLAPPPGRIRPYTGRWDDPDEWRAEVAKALKNAFGATEVDTSSSVAMTISEVQGSRPSTDVVPSFLFKRFESSDQSKAHIGSRVFTTTGDHIDNWPEQQRLNGQAKDKLTNGRYKRYVRALKNAENHLVRAGQVTELPSYYMECLVWNVPDQVINHGDLYTGFQITLATLLTDLDKRDEWWTWDEPNQLKWLFRGHTKWTAAQGKDLAVKTYLFLDW